MEKLRLYLGEATLCRLRAETSDDPKLRELYLEQAKSWDRLADAREWLVLCRHGALQLCRRATPATLQEGGDAERGAYASISSLVSLIASGPD